MGVLCPEQPLFHTESLEENVSRPCCSRHGGLEVVALDLKGAAEPQPERETALRLHDPLADCVSKCIWRETYIKQPL